MNEKCPFCGVSPADLYWHVWECHIHGAGTGGSSSIVPAFRICWCGMGYVAFDIWRKHIRSVGGIVEHCLEEQLGSSNG